MSDVLGRYKKLDYSLPEGNLAWRMYESGVENFGVKGADVLSLPKPKHDEVLLRVDAIGICFSDVKLITQGPAHARITGRDLANDPVTPGHEPSLTVVEAGDDWKDKYKPGDRFIVQADVYYKGANLAYGYALPGAMQQYSLVGKEVLDGDEGSYLIPVQKAETGYAEAALVEPWTCVIASYRIHPRKALKAGGTTLIVCVEEGEYVIDGSICADGAPGKIILAGLPDSLSEGICGCGGCSAEMVKVGKLSAGQVKALAQERTGDKGFDDVIVLGTPSPELAEALGEQLAKNAVMAIVASKPMSAPIKVDVGRVHYDYIDYVGTKTNRVADAYANSRDSEIKPGGTAWYVGAAGPMGSMHVQRAAKMANGPKKMLCTDVDNHRLDCLRASIADSVRENGIEVVYMNPVEDGQDAIDKAIAQLTGGKGFDDIVVSAPVAALIEQAIPHLAEGGLLNIFAGVVRGTMATIDLTSTYVKGNRFVGSSGSRPQDMVDTLGFTEAGELPTRASLAAIGGIDAMADGVRAVHERLFPGKTVIFPQITLPLTALTDLDKVAPNVFAKLKDGQFWTNEAEEELLSSKLEL